MTAFGGRCQRLELADRRRRGSTALGHPRLCDADVEAFIDSIALQPGPCGAPAICA